MNEITYWSFREGTSDKVYELEIRQEGGLYFVEGRNGRRGSTLTQQVKTKNGPVPYAEARNAYDAEVRNRQRKRYVLDRTVNPTGTNQAAPASSTPVATPPPQSAAVAPASPIVQLRPDTGLRAMLLTAIDDEAHVQSLLADDAFGLETKHDGRRVMLMVTALWDGGLNLRAANRDGDETKVPQEVSDGMLLTRAGRFVIDGELVGCVYHPYDLLEDGGKCIRHLPQSERAARLATLLSDQCPFPRTLTVTGTAAKTAALADLYARGAEGGVFKRLDAPYSPGRSRDAFKRKFLASATVAVLKANKKRSIEVGVLRGGALVGVGNVTIPPNHDVPAVGTFVEVGYQDIKRGGDLYQPIYKGVREDKREADDYESLSFKGEERLAA